MAPKKYIYDTDVEQFYELASIEKCSAENTWSFIYMFLKDKDEILPDVIVSGIMYLEEWESSFFVPHVNVICHSDEYVITGVARNKISEIFMSIYKNLKGTFRNDDLRNNSTAIKV